MKRLSHYGWVSPFIPPQPTIAPTTETYLGMIDAFLSSNEAELAWEKLVEMDTLNLPRNTAIFRKYFHGCFVLMKPHHIMDAIYMAKRDDIRITRKMGSQIVRMYGSDHLNGLDMIRELGMSGLLCDELAEACAYAHNSEGAKFVVCASKAAGFAISATLERSMLVCCMNSSIIQEALNTLSQLQKDGFVLKIPVYISLLHEIYVKYTNRKQGILDDTGFKKAIKVCKYFIRRNKIVAVASKAKF